MISSRSVLRMSLFRWLPLAPLSLVAPHAASAQGWEIAVFGGEVLSQTRDIQPPAGGKLQIPSGYAGVVHFDHTLWYSHIAEPHLEIEFTVLAPRRLRSISAAVPQSYDALYLTLGLRLEFLPRALLRPGWSAEEATRSTFRARCSPTASATAFAL